MNPVAEQDKIINYFSKSSVYCIRMLIIRDSPFFWVVVSDSRTVANSNSSQKIFYPPKALARDLGSPHKRPRKPSQKTTSTLFIHTLILFLSVFHEVFPTGLTRPVGNTIPVFNLGMVRVYMGQWQRADAPKQSERLPDLWSVGECRIYFRR